MEAEIEELVALIEAIAHYRTTLEGYWIGRCVCLRQSFGELPSPEEGQVLLPAGAIGWIVKLQLDVNSPFVIEFPGFPYRIAPLLEKLEFLDRQLERLRIILELEARENLLAFFWRYASQ